MDRPFRGLGITSATFPGLDHYNSAGEILSAGLAALLG